MTGQNQCLFLTGLRKQPTFSDVTTGFPLKWHLRDKRTNSILMMHWCEVYMKSEQWCIISMEFLCTFLRCHITWKSKVASQNVGCFLRLIFDWTLSMTPSGAWSNTRFSFWLTRMHTWQTVTLSEANWCFIPYIPSLPCCKNMLWILLCKVFMLCASSWTKYPFN